MNLRPEIVFKTRLGLFQYLASSFVEWKTQPDYFIAPNSLTDLETGLLLFDIENYILRNIGSNITKKVTVICADNQKEKIMTYISISLFGVSNYDENEFQKEFHTSYTQGCLPNLKIETKLFYSQNFKINLPLSIDLFVEFLTYDQKIGTVRIGEDFDLYFQPQYITINDNGETIHTINRAVSQNSFIKILYLMNKQTLGLRPSHRSISLTRISLTNEENFKSPVQTEEMDSELIFNAPLFGVTPLSHPMNLGSIQGLIIWINGRAALVDPPPFTKELLKVLKITTRVIDWVILTNVQTRTDFGLLQRLIQSQRLEIITTPMLLKGFLTRQALVLGQHPDLMRKLIKFKPVLVGATINLNGSIIRFSYGYSYSPTLIFELCLEGKQVLYTGTNYFDPKEY